MLQRLAVGLASPARGAGRLPALEPQGLRETPSVTMLVGMTRGDEDPRGEFPAGTTASDLRRRATGLGNRKIVQAVAQIINRCEAAADAGELAVSISLNGGAGWFPYAIRNGVKQALEARGFKVNYYNGDQRDPDTGITVSW